MNKILQIKFSPFQPCWRACSPSALSHGAWLGLQAGARASRPCVHPVVAGQLSGPETCFPIRRHSTLTITRVGLHTSRPHPLPSATSVKQRDTTSGLENVLRGWEGTGPRAGSKTYYCRTLTSLSEPQFSQLGWTMILVL